LFRLFSCFFLCDPAASRSYILSLHDALPICIFFEVRKKYRGSHAPDEKGASSRARRMNSCESGLSGRAVARSADRAAARRACPADRKSTRLNSSHVKISYAVFCLKKKKHHPQ